MSGLKINLNALKNNIKKDSIDIEDIKTDIVSEENLSIEEKFSTNKKVEDKKDKDIILDGLKSLNYLDDEENEKEEMYFIDNSAKEIVEENNLETVKTETKIENESIKTEENIQKTEVEKIKESHKQEEIIENNTSTLNLEEIKTKSITKENSPVKINLSNIKEVKEENIVPIKIFKNSQVENSQVEEQTNKEIFPNYKSDFKNKQNFIFAKLEKLRSLPKTSFGILLILIVLSVGTIATLFFINPKHHNLNRYKTSVLNILNNKQINIVENKQTDKEPEINSGYTNNSNKNEVVKEESKKNSAIGISYEIKNIDGVDKYIYNGETFDNILDLAKSIKK